MSVAEPAAVSAGDQVSVRVRAVASSGAGVADLPDGRVAFVHRTAPGDDAVVRVTRVRPRWAAASLVEVETPGPERDAPPCPLYAACGGCTLQHLTYPAQLAWKGRFVADALQRIGGVPLAPPEVAASPSRLRYRNRITLTVLRLRGGRVVAGFHALERPDRLVDMTDECLLPEEPLVHAWAALRQAWGPGARRLPGGRELRITLRSVEDGVAILVRGGGAGWDPGNLLDSVPGGRALWHQPEGGTPTRVAGAPTEEIWEGERVPVGGRAFLQVNREAAAALTAHVLDLVDDPTPTDGDDAAKLHAVDAYSGVGVYGRALARRGWRVTGIELDAEACAAAAHDAPDGFEVVEGRVEERLAGCLPADLVIANPPRTGLDERVPQLLVASAPARLIYVSCDPATLARDTVRLAPAYTLTGVRSFDLFPHTAHVETVALFTRHAPDEAA